MRRPLYSLVLIACLCLAGACIPYRPFTLPNEEWQALAKNPKEQAKYRKSIRPCTDLTEHAADTRLREQCTFSVIEFDDQGELWRPRQLEDTLDLIAQSSHRGPEPRKALVVIFVHGWKNNASPDNEANRNLGSFKKVLIQLTQEEMRRGEAQSVQTRPVIGVYLSWRGRASNNWLLSQLSFFGRKNAAARVARVSFSHAIFRIVAATKGIKARTRGNPDSVAVVVGHSFGGLIVENTLLRSLTMETDNFEEFGADLAVLVNPANEAILARQFVQALHQAPARPLQLEGRKISQPLIVSVTSVSDNATGKIFPIGLSIKSVGKRFHKYEDGEPGIERQKFYYTHTPGHSTPEGALYSHTLTCPFTDGDCAETPKTGKEYEAAMAQRMHLTAQEEGFQTIFPPPAVQLGSCARAPEQSRNFECIDHLWFMGAGTGQIYSINRALASPNQTGYWILQMPSTIVSGHSDIFQSELTSLLAALINLKLAQVVADPDAAQTYLESLYPDAPGSIVTKDQ